MTALKKPEKKPIITDSMYDKMIAEMESILVLTLKERRNLNNNPVARFIAEIPFLTRQTIPEIKAVMNLVSYITGSRNKSFFAQRPGQNIRDRIDSYLHGSDGEKETMELCRDILEEVSLYDHQNDMIIDKEMGSYNPVLQGEINFLTEKRKLKRKRLTYSNSARDLVEAQYSGNILAFFWAT